MDIEFKGGNCITITGKKDTFVVDPGLAALGLKDQAAKATAIILTQDAFGASAEEGALVIDGPGEYEVKNCSIRGVAAKRHSEINNDSLKATIYRLDQDGISLAVIGHVDSKLTDEQLEVLGVVDVLVIPVGGGGYTLDAKAAVEVVREIEPKVVIPTHYADADVKYEVPQQSVDDFIKELGVSVEETPKLKLKAGSLPASLTVYKIARTK